MTLQTVTWCPPSCCGCQLQITGDFDPNQVYNGVSYKHPIPYSITAINIINVCAQHLPNSQSMMDTSVFFDTPSPQAGTLQAFLSQAKGITPTVAPVQNRGYLKYPITNPTPAQCLYSFLSQYGGTKHTMPCGCSRHTFKDEKGNLSYPAHPVFTSHCAYHQNDTPDLQQATIDLNNYTAQASIAAIP